MNVLYRQINEQEVKDVKSVSQTFHDRFVAKHLFLRPGAQGADRICASSSRRRFSC